MTQRERQILRWIEEDPMISQQELADKAGITRSSAAVHISNLMKKGHIAGRGYIVRTAPYAVVVGGVNMDVGGRSYEGLIPRDSNPGRVRMSLGGVGRNIAHNMALMGVEVHLLTAFGDDVSAQKVAASCGELNIDISHALQVPGGATSTYLYIAGSSGDMELAVADIRDILGQMAFYEDALGRLMQGTIQGRRGRLDSLGLKLRIVSPLHRISEKKMEAVSAEERLLEAMGRVVQKKRHALEIYIERMKGLSPLERLGSGCAYVTDGEGRNIRSVEQAAAGQALAVRVKDGIIDVVVSGTRRQELP